MVSDEKKAEHQRTNSFELWYWIRLFRVPWTARRSNQLILKEINPEYSLEGPMLKLKLQYFRHLVWRTDSFEKTLMLGKIEDRKRRGRPRMKGWMASPTWTWVWATSGRCWRTGKPGALQSTGSQRVGHDLGTERQQQSEEMADNWNKNKGYFCSSKCVKGSSPYSKIFGFKYIYMWLFRSITFFSDECKFKFDTKT